MEEENKFAPPPEENILKYVFNLKKPDSPFIHFFFSNFEISDKLNVICFLLA